MKNLNSLLTLAVLGALTQVGCATGGAGSSEVKVDPQAAAKSRAYLESMVLVPASERSVNAPCSMPKDAEKLVTNSTLGPSKEWKNWVARANTCVGEKRWTILEQIANLLARVDMDSPWGAYYLSVAAEGNGDWQRALWMAELAQKKTGGHSGLSTFQKGRILLAMKETAKGMAEINKAVAIEPSLAEGHLYLAEIYHRDFDFDTAATHYAAVLAVDGKNYRALTGLAEVKLQQSSPAEAVALYNRALGEKPDQLRPWVRLAFIYETVQKNGQLALNTYKGLKVKLEGGKMHEKPDFDLNAKIKALEETVKAPAQASVAPVDETRSTK